MNFIRTSSLRNWVVYNTKMYNRPVALTKSKFRDIEQGYTWNNLIRAYDLRYWYMNQGINQGQGFKYCQEVEYIHDELNYQHSKGIFYP